MRRIVWSGEALANLDAIQDYIHEFSPMAAERFAARLAMAANSLIDFPERGRAIGVGDRELVIVAPYIIRYLLRGDDVVILNIRHGARERP